VEHRFPVLGRDTRVDVAVVGGGIAGISCAFHLQNAGYRVIVLEKDEVCLWYDLKTTGPTVFMSSWYQVRDAKIASIQTIFDPRAFASNST
jgi:thioredoxin reductase